jgi:hypothetical protein
LPAREQEIEHFDLSGFDPVTASALCDSSKADVRNDHDLNVCCQRALAVVIAKIRFATRGFPFPAGLTPNGSQQ